MASCEPLLVDCSLSLRQHPRSPCVLYPRLRVPLPAFTRLPVLRYWVLNRTGLPLSYRFGPTVAEQAFTPRQALAVCEDEEDGDEGTAAESDNRWQAESGSGCSASEWHQLEAGLKTFPSAMPSEVPLETPMLSFERLMDKAERPVMLSFPAYRLGGGSLSMRIDGLDYQGPWSADFSPASTHSVVTLFEERKADNRAEKAYSRNRDRTRSHSRGLGVRAEATPRGDRGFGVGNLMPHAAASAPPSPPASDAGPCSPVEGVREATVSTGIAGSAASMEGGASPRGSFCSSSFLSSRAATPAAEVNVISRRSRFCQLRSPTVAAALKSIFVALVAVLATVVIAMGRVVVAIGHALHATAHCTCGPNSLLQRGCERLLQRLLLPLWQWVRAVVRKLWERLWGRLQPLWLAACAAFAERPWRSVRQLAAGKQPSHDLIHDVAVTTVRMPGAFYRTKVRPCAPSDANPRHSKCTARNMLRPSA